MSISTNPEISDPMVCSAAQYTQLVTARTKMTALLLDRAESYQRDAGVIRQAGRHAEAVAYETVAAELRKVAEEVGR